MELKKVLDYEKIRDPRLRNIPFVVRMKLDLANVKISLSDWNNFGEFEKINLIDSDVSNNERIRMFLDYLKKCLIKSGNSDPKKKFNISNIEKPWLADEAPIDIVRFCGKAGIIYNWLILDKFERFLLFHAARKNDIEFANALALEMPNIEKKILP